MEQLASSSFLLIFLANGRHVWTRNKATQKQKDFSVGSGKVEIYDFAP